MMELIKKEKPQTADRPPASDRRAGMDRRRLTYDWYIPERRNTADRRSSEACTDHDEDHGEWRNRRRYA